MAKSAAVFRSAAVAVLAAVVAVPPTVWASCMACYARGWSQLWHMLKAATSCGRAIITCWFAPHTMSHIARLLVLRCVVTAPPPTAIDHQRLFLVVAGAAGLITYQVAVVSA